MRLHLVDKVILVLLGVADESEHLREGLDVWRDFVLRQDGEEPHRSANHQESVLGIAQRSGNCDDIVEVGFPLQQIWG